MIVFEKIRWRNFLSTGNQFTEMTLNESKSQLVIGSNGAGKSTMLDALCFVLFNKPFRKISKSQLVNSVNEKECVVEVEFSIGKVNYHVIRGIKPNVFKVNRNGQLLDQTAANKDYQKYLEQSILKFNYKSFTQVVILGSSTFVPFMQLPATHRREVVEDLLDIKIFSKMNTILKDRVKDNKDNFTSCKHTLEICETKLNHQRASIHKLTELQEGMIQKLQNKFTTNEDGIVNLNTRKKENDHSMSVLAHSVSNQADVQEKYDSLRDMRSKIEQNKNKAEKDHKFYTKHDKCPTCSQTLEEEHKHRQLVDAESRRDKYKEGYKMIDEQISLLYDKLRDLKGYGLSIIEFQSDNLSIDRQIKRLLKDNEDIMAECNKETPDIDAERVKLDEYEVEFAENVERCAGVSKEFDNLKVVSTLLRDSGIKSKVISKFVPIFNSLINKYLQCMDFFVNFTLDEEFNEVIKSRYRDVFSYASFSEGEKQKIDLSLLFCWRDIAKMKNSASTNLLILDEVFDSSLDTAATDELMKILKGMDDRTNLFVISHKGDILLDKFDTVVTFDKVGDFSTMKQDSL
jgi:DNA repair exonuclease SbcCD ATPase subunit